jgi:hypothetical protein
MNMAQLRMMRTGYLTVALNKIKKSRGKSNIADCFAPLAMTARIRNDSPGPQ